MKNVLKDQLRRVGCAIPDSFAPTTTVDGRTLTGTLAELSQILVPFDRAFRDDEGRDVSLLGVSVLRDVSIRDGDDFDLYTFAHIDRGNWIIALYDDCSDGNLTTSILDHDDPDQTVADRGRVPLSSWLKRLSPA